jgi:hypothetical protein
MFLLALPLVLCLRCQGFQVRGDLQQPLHVRAACSKLEYERVEKLWHGGNLSNLKTSACVDDFYDVEDVREIFGERKVSTQAELSQKRLAPTLFYIGPGHSGSTTLADLMNAHPNLSYGAKKEHKFFCGHAWERTWDNYVNEFWVDSSVTRTFDASINYIWMGSENDPACQARYTPGLGAVQNFAKTIQDNTHGATLQFIAMFRNPVDWVCSRYKPRGWCDNETIMEHTLNEYQKQPCYAEYLESFLSVFDRSQFLFLNSEDAFENQESVINQVWDFVGVPRTPFEYVSSGRRRNQQYSTEGAKVGFFQTDKQQQCKQRLEQMTGLTFAW